MASRFGGTAGNTVDRLRHILGLVAWTSLPLSVALSTLAFWSDWWAVGLATGAGAFAAGLHFVSDAWLKSMGALATAFAAKDAAIRSSRDAERRSAEVCKQLRSELDIADDHLRAAREKSERTTKNYNRQVEKVRAGYEAARARDDAEAHMERLTMIRAHQTERDRLASDLTATLERAGRAEAKLYPSVAERCRNQVLDILNHGLQAAGTNRISIATLRAKMGDTDLGMLLAVLKSLQEAQVVHRSPEGSSRESDEIRLIVPSECDSRYGVATQLHEMRDKEEGAKLLSRVERLHRPEAWTHMRPIMGNLLNRVDALIEELPPGEAGALVQARRRFYASDFDDEQTFRNRVDDLEAAVAKVGDAAEPFRKLSRMVIGEPLGEPAGLNYDAWRAKG